MWRITYGYFGADGRLIEEFDFAVFAEERHARALFEADDAIFNVLADEFNQDPRKPCHLRIWLTDGDYVVDDETEYDSDAWAEANA